MSHKNPTVNEMKQTFPESRLVGYLSKSLLNLAKGEFWKVYRRRASLDDALELVRIFDKQWGNYYSEESIRQREEETSRLFKSWLRATKRGELGYQTDYRY